MRKNLVVQLIYRMVACGVSFLAVILSFNIFFYHERTAVPNWEIFKYYTNLSNYFVFVVSMAVLIGTIRRVLRGEREGYNRVWRTFKFMTVVMILVTFLVYLILLGNPLSLGFWTDLGNLSYHVLAPILFILDYILFEEKKSISVLAPVYSLIIPLVYVGYIFILGAAIGNFVYPYFFLDVHTLGYGGVLLWVLALLVVFTVLGYLLWLWNRLEKKDGKLRFDFHNVLHPLRKNATDERSESDEAA